MNCWKNNLQKPKQLKALFCHLSPPQAWWTARYWSRWSEATACPAPRGAPSPCTRWWSSAGRRTRTRGPLSSTSSPSWRTISLPQSHSTNLERTYSLPGLCCVSLRLGAHYVAWHCHKLLFDSVKSRLEANQLHKPLLTLPILDFFFFFFAFSVRLHLILLSYFFVFIHGTTQVLAV